MRLWHKDLIPYLPRQQLLGQWRECCLIAKNIKVDGTPNHVLVNRILEYPISHFVRYARQIYFEMKHRGYGPDIKRFGQYVADIHAGWNMQMKDVFPGWHNNRYLKQCLYNLEEKAMCHAIPKEEWQIIIDKYGSEFDLWNC